MPQNTEVTPILVLMDIIVQQYHKIVGKLAPIVIKNLNFITSSVEDLAQHSEKKYDVIVGMYHDALQSGLKAFGFDRGVTVQGGLPIPITTPAHGTAFDIAGKNQANLEPTLQSFKIAITMAQNISKHD